jgi:hypothetical protein
VVRLAVFRFGRTRIVWLRIGKRSFAFRVGRSHTDPADLHELENWAGGSYELAIELGPVDHNRLQLAVVAIWGAAEIRGSFVRAEREPREHIPAALSLPEGGTLYGFLRLPTGKEIVCSVWALTEADGSIWLSLSLPLGALGLLEPRVGSFPLGEDGGPASLVWRRQIDEWFANVVARRVFEQTPFKVGLIGWEPAGEGHAAQPDGAVPAERPHSYVVPVDGVLHYYEATN